MRPMTIVKGMIARVGIRPIPIAVTYEVTWLCNLACGYCDRHTPMRNEMNHEQIFEALEEFIGLGMSQIHLDGGDPLTHKHIDEIVEWLGKEKKAVFTNSKREPGSKNIGDNPHPAA